MGIEEMFAGMDTAQGSSSGVFFTNGVYKVELAEIEYRPNGYKGKSVFFRFKVLESNNPEHAPGATRVWICKLGKKPDDDKRTMADIKGLIFALTGTSLKEVGSPEQNPKAHAQATAAFLAACDKTYADKNNIAQDMLVGSECALECQAIKVPPRPGKPDESTFTRHIWSPTAN
jgi:hypothetical protein